MTTTPRIGAPVLVSGQATPETTVNEQAYLFDAFTCPHFKDRDLTAPPGSPAQGDCYLVAASPTGAWTGQAGKVAVYINTSWTFVTAKEGFLFWVDDENLLILYDGAAWNTVGLAAGSYVPTSYLDTDGTLAANSDVKLATQKAVKTYVDTAVTGLLDLKGTTDCSANPNYPAASKGDYYVVTVAGKIGGASGATVAIGDVYFATADNAGGTQAAVGSSWDILVHASVAAGGGLLAANNLSDVANVGTSRTNLGATIVGGNLFTVANPSAITFLRVNADNSVSLLSASSFRTAIGAGTGGGDLSGPASSVDNHVAIFDSTTGKLLKDGGVGILANGCTITPQATPATNEVGYLGCPQNTQNGTYTTVMSDAGKHIYHTSGSAHTWTIDSNANVAYPIGTILTFINENGGGIVTLAITSDTLRWGSSTGSRSLAANGTATAIKVSSTTWRLTGDGIT